jgi:hypothetical protein
MKMILYGERCSGTKWAQNLLQSNFNNPWSTGYEGKHWMLSENSFEKLKLDDETVFLVVYRNISDWLQSLHIRPYHAPNHVNVSFDEFITKPWVSIKTHLDWGDRTNVTKDNIIESSENIVKFRKEKISNWLRISEYTDKVLFIKYEDLFNDTFSILEKLQSLGLQRKNSEWTMANKKLKMTTHKPISNTDLILLNEIVDWEFEKQLGYE